MLPQKFKVYRKISTGDTNADVIRSGASELKGWSMYGATAGPYYVKIYDKSTTPDETDTPILTIAVRNRANSIEELPGRLVFNNGIAIRITGGLADNDTTPLISGDMVANIFYN